MASISINAPGRASPPHTVERGRVGRSKKLPVDVVICRIVPPISEHHGGFYDVVEVEIGKPKDGVDVHEGMPRLGLYIARPYEAPLGIDTQALMREDIHEVGQRLPEGNSGVPGRIRVL